MSRSLPPVCAMPRRNRNNGHEGGATGGGPVPVAPFPPTGGGINRGR